MLHALVIGYFICGAAGFALIVMLLLSAIRWKNPLIFYVFLFSFSLILILEANSINFYRKLMFPHFPYWQGALVIGCIGYLIFFATVPLLYLNLRILKSSGMIRVVFFLPCLFFTILSIIVFIIPDRRYVYRILLEYTVLQLVSWIYSSGLAISLLIRDKTVRSKWILPITAFLILSPFLLMISYTLMPGSADDKAVPYWLYLVQIAAFFLWIIAFITGIRLKGRNDSKPGNFLKGFGLTAREKEVALLVIQGLTNPEMAEKLAIATETVKKHIQNIYQKTGCESKIELVNRLVIHPDSGGLQ